jgi:hypothetical protein
VAGTSASRDNGNAPLSIETRIDNTTKKQNQITKYAVVYLAVGDNAASILENSLISLRRHTDADIYLYCPDGIEKLFQPLQKKYKITVIAGLTEDISSATADYGTPVFNLITHQKWAAIDHTLKLGYDFVVYCDFDVVILNDFGAYIERAAKTYPVGIQSECSPKFPPEYCTGFMYFNNSNFSRHLLSLSTQCSAEIGSLQHDQYVFNEVVGNSNPELRQRILALPESLFANGLQYRTFLNGEKVELTGRLQPFIFHANWVVGLENKIKLLKHLNLWFAS